MRRAKTTGLLLALLLGAGVAACAPEQEGLLVIEGLALDDCQFEDPYELKLDFVAFDSCDDILLLRMQHSGRRASDSDGIALQIEGMAALQEQLKAGPVDISLPSESVRLGPYFNDVCGSSLEALEAGTGWIHIEALEPKDGGDLELSAEFDLIDIRTGNVVSPHATLTMSATLTISPLTRCSADVPSRETACTRVRTTQLRMDRLPRQVRYGQRSPGMIDGQSEPVQSRLSAIFL